ncbi:MAG: hypothetical protein HFG32_02030 [Eubacterium sp.]|jgi:hypothetical protein|nr:hypothetical protein [Eubacterium sp.]
MLSSAGAISEAATMHSYDFFMNGKGGADRSNDQKKEESGPALVRLRSISTSAAPGLPLTMRVRRSKNDGKATVSMDFAKYEDGGRYLNYNPGYGGTDDKYYLKMQTNSKASQCAWVDGTWRP